MTPAQLIAQVPRLPAPSPGVLRLVTLLANETADGHEIFDAVRQDALLSAKLLRLCNSAASGRSTPAASVDQAIMFLGQDEVRRLITALGVAGNLSPAMPGYVIGSGELWRHSLLTAHVAAALTKEVSGQHLDPSVAYTAGLMHDIGKLVLSFALTEEHRKMVLQRLEQDRLTLVEAERAELGTDHAEVGACLLQSWQLPEVLIEAVANHHQPVSEPTLKLSAVVHVADLLALEAGCAPGIGSFAKRADAAATAALGITDSGAEDWVLRAMDLLVYVQTLEKASC